MRECKKIIDILSLSFFKYGHPAFPVLCLFFLNVDLTFEFEKNNRGTMSMVTCNILAVTHCRSCL